MQLVVCKECTLLTRPCPKHIPYKREAKGLLFDVLTGPEQINVQGSHVITRTMQHLDGENMSNTYASIDSDGCVLPFSTIA